MGLLETNTIEKTIKNFKLFAFTAIGLSVVLNIVLLIYAIQVKNESEDKVYFISEKAAYKGMPIEQNIRSEYEVKNHAYMFMYYMFSYDKITYEKHVDKALHLIDNVSGKEIYNQFKEKKVLDNLQKYDTKTEIEVDSIFVNSRVVPIEVKVYAKRYLIYSDHVGLQPIGAKFGVMQSFRSDVNPHGLQIVNFEFFSYDRAIQEIAEKEKKNE